jgi:uncharacterized MAPEG superfamily protein
MQELLMPYHTSLIGLLALAVLAVTQFLVADVVSIREKQVPGMPVSGGHDSFLFRATRANANTAENLALFLLLVLLCFFSAANPHWTAVGIWIFAAARAGHMGFYYADMRTLRSTAFGVGLVGELILLAVACLALC